jgi:uncharacterized protein YegP (UPF0339 family)
VLRRIFMTGMFELFIDEGTLFRFRLKAPDGTVVAVSRSFPDKRAAVSGISEVREYAGMGLVTDLCPEVPLHGTPAVPPAEGTRQGGTLADLRHTSPAESLPLATAHPDRGAGLHEDGSIDRHRRGPRRHAWAIRGHEELPGQNGQHALKR